MRNEQSFCSATRPLRDDSHSLGGNTTTAFLCLGSLGDCLPLCALAASLPSHVHSRHDPNCVDERRQQGGDKDRLGRLPEVARCGATGEDGADCPNETVGLDTTRCVLVTHRCHSDLLRGLMADVYNVAQPPELCPVDIPILFSCSHGRSRSDAGSSTTPTTNDGSGGGDGETSSSLAGDEEGGVSRELDVCMDVLRSVRPKALIFNLYSSFGYHLADALGIPCACASPGVPPSLGGSVPLGRVLPRALLKRLMDEERPDTNAGEGTEVSKADLDLWMLPLFQPRYRRWRLARALLPFPRWPTLPSAPLAMFGVSPAVLPRPGYWPPKADVYGFWSFAKLSRRFRAPEMLERFLERCNSVQKPIFCVGLGSMPGLGLAQDPNGILSMAVRCLLEAGAGVVLLPTPSYASLHGGVENDFGNGRDAGGEHHVHRHHEQRQQNQERGRMGGQEKGCEDNRSHAMAVVAESGSVDLNERVSNSGGENHERINSRTSINSIDSVGVDSAAARVDSAATGLNSATVGFNSAAAGFSSAAAGFNSASTGFNSAAAAAAVASVTAADGDVDPTHFGVSVERAAAAAAPVAMASLGDATARNLTRGALFCDARKRRREEAVGYYPNPLEHEKQHRKQDRRSSTLSEAVGQEFVLDLEDGVFVPHSWLLPRCRGIVHHGGSGTVGAALRAGAVQAVIPFAFDQFFFADQVEHMGVGVRVPGTRPCLCPGVTEGQRSEVTLEGLRSAVTTIFGGECRASAARYRALLAEEDGVNFACEAIVEGLNL